MDQACGEVHRDRLLAQHVPARRGGEQGVLAVQAVDGADVDGVDVLARHQVLDVGDGGRNGMRRGESLGAREGAAGDRGDRLAERAHRRDHPGGSDVAATGQAPAHHRNLIAHHRVGGAAPARPMAISSHPSGGRLAVPLRRTARPRRTAGRRRCHPSPAATARSVPRLSRGSARRRGARPGSGSVAEELQVGRDLLVEHVLPTWMRQPRSMAACRNGVMVCFITTSATNVVGAMRSTSIGSGSPSFMPSGVALTTRS